MMLAYHALPLKEAASTRNGVLQQQAEHAAGPDKSPAHEFETHIAEQTRRFACSLTEREIQTMTLVALGYSNKQVAGALSITENTVKTYLKAIFKKLNVENRTAAALKVIRSGLVSPSEPC